MAETQPAPRHTADEARRGVSPIWQERIQRLRRAPVFNESELPSKKNRVSRHVFTVFNGQSAEIPLTTENTCHSRRPSTRKPLTTENTCHEMGFYLRAEGEIVEYRKFAPPISCIQRQIVEYRRRVALDGSGFHPNHPGVGSDSGLRAKGMLGWKLPAEAMQKMQRTLGDSPQVFQLFTRPFDSLRRTKREQARSLGDGGDSYLSFD